MEKYNPLIEPNKEQWLNSSEKDRMETVRAFHKDNVEGLDDEAVLMHVSIHVIVENQLALGVECIPETIAKLTRQGLDRHEAIHAIGSMISEDIFNIIRGEKTEFSLKKYRKKLEKITAKRWRKGQY